MKKRDLIADAFAEIALAGYTFDLTADEMQTGLRRLDDMMAMLSTSWVDIGYDISGESDLDDEAGIGAEWREPVVTNLAMRLAPAFGKVITNETRVTARAGWQRLIALGTRPASQADAALTAMRGAGNRRRF